MASPRKLIHIWIEGLYERDAPFALAWVVKNADGGYDEHTLSLPFNVDGCEEFGPECAEMMAIVMALKSLPPKSAVVIHTGSQGLIRWMEHGRDAYDIRQNQGWLAAPPFRQSFEMALEQVGRTISTSFQYVRKNNEGMELARSLAEAVLWPPEDD